MKKFEKLSRAEMKNVKGGLHPDPCEAGVGCTAYAPDGVLIFGTCLSSCLCYSTQYGATFNTGSTCNSNVQ